MNLKPPIPPGYLAYGELQFSKIDRTCKDCGTALIGVIRTVKRCADCQKKYRTQWKRRNNRKRRAFKTQRQFI